MVMVKMLMKIMSLFINRVMNVLVGVVLIRVNDDEMLVKEEEYLCYSCWHYWLFCWWSGCLSFRFCYHKWVVNLLESSQLNIMQNGWCSKFVMNVKCSSSLSRTSTFIIEKSIKLCTHQEYEIINWLKLTSVMSVHYRYS